jgi:HPt (histidine-containing phosphotransfer) domain-containing protein
MEQPPKDPIDVRRLRDSLTEAGVPALFRELVSVFLHETPERLAMLRRAVVAEDRRTMKLVAHTLKGTSGYLGARGLSEICLELEGVGTTASPGAGLPLLDALDAEFVRVRAALERELGGVAHEDPRRRG